MKCISRNLSFKKILNTWKNVKGTVQNYIKRLNLLTDSISEVHVSHIKVTKREKAIETKAAVIPGWRREKNEVKHLKQLIAKMKSES